MVTDMTKMFYNCSSIKSIDLSSFSPEKTPTLKDIISNCNSLISIDLANLKTGETLENIFSSQQGNLKIKYIDLYNSETQSSSLPNLIMSFINFITPKLYICLK